MRTGFAAQGSVTTACFNLLLITFICVCGSPRREGHLHKVLS